MPESLSRSLVYATRGIVCSNSPSAASAGVSVLAEGGNAFDAALAVAAVEAVTQPPMCGLGGDVFALLYHAASNRIVGLCGSGGAPSGATPATFRRSGATLMPHNGPLSISVPGEVDAWVRMHERFCTKPFRQLLEPAIGYAEEGFALPPKLGAHFAENLGNLRQYPATADVLTRAGAPYHPGERLVQKDLARSLRRVAEGGADEFYRGDLARQMLSALEQAGGLFTADDFARHATEVHEPPIATTYRGRTVYETDPPSQGFMLLEMLNILEGFDLAALGQNSADAIHLMVESKKIAFADRNRHAGDPRFVQWPLDELLSKDYATRMRATIDPARASAQAEPTAVAGDTSYFCVADGQGNCVSFIHSLSKAFGSDFIAAGTGILFNNRAGRGFSLQAGHPNLIAPGKRTMHTLNCFMLFDGARPVLVGGTPGGDLQTQCNLQMLSAIVDGGLDPQAAVEAPRWGSVPGTDPAALDRPAALQVEATLPAETVRALEGKGHRVQVRAPGGVAQLIALDAARGVLAGASDPRGDGHAAGL